MDKKLNIIDQVQSIDLIYVSTKILINIALFILMAFALYYLINIGNNYIVQNKKVKFNRKNYLIGLIVISIGIIIFIIYRFRDIIITNLVPIIWAVVIAYLLNPIVNKLMEFKLSRLWSVIVIYISIIAIVLLFSFTLTPRLTKEVKSLMEVLPTYTNEAFEFINRLYGKYIISMNSLPPEFIGVDVALRDYLEGIQIYIMDFFRKTTEKCLGVFSNVVSIVLVPIYTFYFLKDIKFFRKKVIISIPTVIRKELINVAKDINKLLSSFIRGQLMVAFIVGLISIVALMVLNVQFAFLLGTIAGITDIIPYFGPIIGSIPAIIIALLDNPIKALWVILAFFIIQQLESAVLSPKIVGDRVGLHPVFVIVSLLLGGELFGIVGLIFAVPLAASIKIILNHIIKALIRI